MFAYKISGKFIIKVPQKTRIDLNNFANWLMIRRKENTSHSDTLLVLAFMCYQIPLLLVRSSCLVHSYTHTHRAGVLKGEEKVLKLFDNHFICFYKLNCDSHKHFVLYESTISHFRKIFWTFFLAVFLPIFEIKVTWSVKNWQTYFIQLYFHKIKNIFVNQNINLKFQKVCEKHFSYFLT